MSTRIVFGDTGGDANGSLIVKEDLDYVRGAVNGGGWIDVTRSANDEKVAVNADRIWYLHEQATGRASF